ncbi:MAG: fibrobacter succinogenes major paralogous domain-containing protein [Chlorobium sp.]
MYRRCIFIITEVFAVIFLFAGCYSKSQNVVDGDGNSYPASKIGSMILIGKNLDVAHYRNGDTIPEVREPREWASLTTGAWCYNDNKQANGTTYGKLYNWYAVADPRGLAPNGWHVATEAEWSLLCDQLGGSENAGGALKAPGSWKGSDAGTAANASGFNALPAGARRDTDGAFMPPGEYSRLWTSTELTPISAWGRSLGYFDSALRKGKASKKTGFSVRCVKD